MSLPARDRFRLFMEGVSTQMSRPADFENRVEGLLDDVLREAAGPHEFTNWMGGNAVCMICYREHPKGKS